MRSALRSHIIICDNIEVRSSALREQLKPSRVVLFEPDEINFKIEHSKAVIAEAYIAEEAIKYLIISARSFTEDAQNALLKVIEEPPRNIEIIIITESKSVLLPTIRSRLQIINEQFKKEQRHLDINLGTLNLATLFSFVTAQTRLSKLQAKELVEALYYRATVIDRLALNDDQLNRFERSYKLLDLNARLQPVLLNLLMPFIKVSRAR